MNINMTNINTSDIETEITINETEIQIIKNMNMTNINISEIETENTIIEPETQII